jgi:amino acid adenylation domain-containing protein
MGVPPITAADCDRSIVDRFCYVARCTPDVLAVVDADATLTYRQLDQRSNALAQAIVDRVGPGSGLVAILLDQDADSIVAMLGVLKAGCPYSFADVTMPAARLGDISAFARFEAFVADAAHQDLVEDLAAGRAEVIPLGSGSSELCPRLTIGSDDPANVVFTSGSTGQPKGVAVPHGAQLDHARAAVVSMGFRPDDRMALVLPVGFSAAANYLYRGLTNGAQIHLYDPRRQGIGGLADWLRRARITYLDLTPSLLRAFLATLDDREVFVDLRVVTTAGEPVYGADVAALAAHLPVTSSLVNHTGSTETSGYASYTVPLDGPIPDGQVPSGLALGERVLNLRREDGTEAEGAEPGELCVTSRFVSLGYWREPALTAERFETLADGRRCFRTGDMAVRGADGVLEHKGRRDQMVKVRGYLVEPAEVEVALLGTGEVSAAAVLGVSEPGVPTRLIAYVVPVGAETSAASLRRALRQRLPIYMVPTSVVLLGDLPRSANGKIDRMALRERPVPPSPPPVPPRDDVERRLALAWAEILGVEVVGVEDDFFELGGDSLKSETAMAALWDDFGVSLPTSVLLDAPTVSELANRVRHAGELGAGSTLVALRTTGTRPPLFCVAGAGGLAVTYQPLGLRLGPDQPVYVLQNQGMDNRGLPDFTIEGAARRAIRSIRSVQASGPYLVAGHSWGGFVAYEMARQLTAAGDHVAFLGLIDVIDDRYASELLEGPGPRRVASGPEGAPLDDAVPETRLSRLRWRWKQLGVVRRVVMAAMSHRARTPESGDDFFHYGPIVSRRYRRPPWRGPATVITATGNADDLITMTWEEMLLEEPQRCSVPGDHLSMFREPNVRSLAEVLSRRIGAVLDGDAAVRSPVP